MAQMDWVSRIARARLTLLSQVQLESLQEFKSKWLTSQAELKQQLKIAQDAADSATARLNTELVPLQVRGV